MKQHGSSLLSFNESSHGSHRAGSELLLFSLALTLMVGLSGCNSSQQPTLAVADPEQIEIRQLTAAIADLRNQYEDLRNQYDDLRSQGADLHKQNEDLGNENAQLRQALGTALDAQEQLANQIRQINEELRTTHDDLALVREQLHDLELEHETKPVEHSSSGTMTAQKPQ
jgi:predicted  nucleic acid-binding Zn-ribbon protein